MVRIFLESPARWPAGSQVHRDTQVAAQASRWDSWRGHGTQTHRKREDGQRGEASGSPHASFNSGVSSVYSSDVRDKRLCMSLFSESAVSLCVCRLLPEPATQEDVVAWCTITVSEPWEPQASHSPEWPGTSSSPPAEEQAAWPCSCCSLGMFLPLGADPSDRTICTLGSAGGMQ